MADVKKDNIQDIPSWLTEFDVMMKKIEFFSLSHEEIIKLSGKSREHLSRSIRKYYNLSFSGYINDIRLDYVAKSLIDTDLSVTELFYNSGFENLSYAYVLFKRKFGINPKMMRESANRALE